VAKPIFEGLLSLSGRRDRRSYAWLLVFLMAVQVALYQPPSRTILR